MSSENGVPAESVKPECYGNRRFKEMVIRIVVDKQSSKLCDMECAWNPVVPAMCSFFGKSIKNAVRCQQCLKEFGE